MLYFWETDEDREPGVFSVGRRSKRYGLPSLRALYAGIIFTVESTIVNIGCV
jgi:hypothetical protein